MRILVVEDDLPLANFVRQGLEAESYTVDVVHDGESACAFGGAGAEWPALPGPKNQHAHFMRRLNDQRHRVREILASGCH